MALKSLPDNSDAAKESPPFEEDIYVGPVEESNDIPSRRTSNPIRKNSPGRKLLQSFIQDDAQTIGDFVIYDVVIPKIKDIIFEGIDGALSRILWGDDRGNSINRNGTRSQVAYHSQYRSRYSSSRETKPIETKDFVNTSRDPERIRVIDRREGERILDEANYLLEDTNYVSIKDLYQISRIPDDGNYMNLEYGWYSLRNAYVDKDRTGWVLKMPRPVYLGKGAASDGPRDE